MVLFNILEVLNQLIVLCAVVLVLAFMFKYRDRVLVALTGDERLHITLMDSIWFSLFKCCGTCTGDWTRELTKCPCCPRNHRNTNIVKTIAKLCGIQPYTIELRNVTIGDLPFDRRADFYLSVECAANPAMVTAVQEEKLPKVVHFPEIVTLRLRWSYLEEAVRITVKEAHVFGSTDVCHCHIPAMNLLQWAWSEDDCTKRVVMKPVSLDERETPAWILLEPSLAGDLRDLDNFHGHTYTVRKSVGDHYEDVSIKTFKQNHSLLDGSGFPLQEPLEENLEKIECLTAFKQNLVHMLQCGGGVVICLFLFGRIYFSACWRRYKMVTRSQMLNPNATAFSLAELRNVTSDCHRKFDGTGSDSGTPCNPSYEQVLERCHHRELAWPADQPEPAVVMYHSTNVIGFEVPPLVCHPQTCAAYHLFQKYDVYFPIAVVIYIFVLVCVRVAGRRLVRKMIHHIQSNDAEVMKQRNATLAESKGSSMHKFRPLG